MLHCIVGSDKRSRCLSGLLRHWQGINILRELESVLKRHEAGRSRTSMSSKSNSC